MSWTKMSTVLNMREIGIFNLKVHEILQLKRNEKRGPALRRKVT